MGRYLTRRIIYMIPLLLVASLITFAIMQLAPGGPEEAILGAEVEASIDPEAMAALRAHWGLDDPIPVQYVRWLGNIFKGDFGRSYFYRLPVMDVIVNAMPNTLKLNVISITLIYAIAIPVGVISAVKQYSKFDYMVTSIAFAGQAAPTFWIAILLIWSVALQSNGLIPTNGIATPGINLETYGWLSVLGDRLKYMILPIIVIVFGGLTGLTRYMRASMLDVLREDYIRTARSKGLREKVVIYKHTMRNALLPIITTSGGLLSSLLGGSVVIEQVFSWPGLGRVGYDAVRMRDYNVSMAVVMMAAVLTLTGYLLVDVAYVLVDPRIKYD